MKKEGIPLELGGYEPLYFQPLYQKRIAFGKKGFPFIFSKKVKYKKGICPIAEKMWNEELFYFPIDEVMPPLKYVKLFGKAIKKVLSNHDLILSKFGK